MKKDKRSKHDMPTKISSGDSGVTKRYTDKSFLISLQRLENVTLYSVQDVLKKGLKKATESGGRGAIVKGHRSHHCSWRGYGIVENGSLKWHTASNNDGMNTNLSS